MYKWKMNNNVEDSQEPQTSQPYYITLTDNNVQQTQISVNIRIVENKIFFYNDISVESCLELNRILIELDQKLQTLKHILDSYEPIIHLRINTLGGDITAAFSTVDIIKNLKSKVYTYVDGNVASAGTLISIVGTKRLMGKNAYMLIHQLSTFFEGKYSELQDTYSNTSVMMRTIKDFYKKYTKIPMKKLDELLQKDLYLTSEECLNYGLVDELF